MALSPALYMASLITTTGDVKASRFTALESEYADSSEAAVIIQNKKMLYFSTLLNLPVNNVVEGTRAFVQENQRFYIYINNAWLSTQLADAPLTTSFDSSSYYIDSANDAILTMNTQDSDNANFIYSYEFIPSNIVDSAIDHTISNNQLIISKKNTAFGIYDFKVIGSVSDGIFLDTDSANINMVLQRINSLEKNTNVISELGGTVTFSLDVDGYPNGYEFPYSISGTNITAGDINQPLTGNITVNNGVAELSLSATSDFTSEGNETLLFSAGGFTESVLIADSSGTPSYSLSGVTSANEGVSVTLTMNYNNHPGGNIDFTISNSSDITYSSGATSYSNGSGYWTSSAGTGSESLVFTTNADYVTEGVENLVLSLTGKGVSHTVTINDTTKTPSVSSVTANASSVNEGSTVTFTVNTANAPNNWRVYWRVLGTHSNSDISSPTLSSNSRTEEGYITISNNTATKSFTIASDATTEGSETLIFDVTRLTNASNVNYALYSSTQQQSVTINDTSQNPVYSAGTSLSGSDQPTNISSYGSQIANPSYSSNSDHLPFISSALQLGDWCYIYTDFYSAARWCQVYDFFSNSSVSHTYVSPTANIYNGWNNRVYPATGASYGSTWKSYTRTTTSMSASELTGRFVWRYRQGSTSGTADRGVIQMADLILSTGGLVGTANGGTAAIAGWETSTGHAYGATNYTDVTTWSSLGSNGGGRWNYQYTNINAYGAYSRSNGTGVRGNPGNNRNFFWTSVHSQSESQVGYYWLRSPEITLPSAYASATFKLGRRGAHMGALEMYWIPS